MKELTSRDIQSINTKNRIAECANKLFTEKSYDDIKITDICKCAGVSVGAFYHYYGSKEDIINDAYNDFDQQTKELMMSKSFSTSLEAVMFLIYCQVKAISDKGYIFATCYFKTQLTTKEKNILNKGRYFYKELLKEVTSTIEKGEVHYESPEKLTDLLLRLSRGFIYDWCLHGGNYDLVQQTMEDIGYILDNFK